MTISGTISGILSQKTPVVHAVTPDNTVYEAILKMAEVNVGALVVMADGELKGVISERDYTRKVALKGKTSKDTYVREILTANVITVTPQTSVDECLRLMTKHRIRHLPVIEMGKLVGIVSIGDLVNWIISSQSHVIEQLTNYISGQY
jgi:CBS domain-containing protein